MKYLGTAVGYTLMLLLTVPRYGGFLLGFFLLFLIPLFLYSGVRMYRHKNELKVRGTKLAIWMAAIFVTLGVNFYRYNFTRDAANSVVAAIVKYHETSGIYPSSLEGLGYGGKSLKSSLGMYGYRKTDGQPSFFYGVPYMIFDTYRYDFDSERWVYSEY